MKEVVVRGLRIGHGQPKICVPLMGITIDDLVAEAKAAIQTSCDIVEWRVDYFAEVKNLATVIEGARALREVLADKPLIVTFRSAREGGVGQLSDEAYFALYQGLIPTRLVDIVDLELLMPSEELAKTVTLAKKYGVRVLMCHHNFAETPKKEEMAAYLAGMAAKEADICKLAVMPQTAKEVLSLLAVTEEMSRKLSQPLVTMSMGELGKVSRLTGELFGSAITFGTVGTASAPGQLPVEELASGLITLSCKK